jgi:alpha-L-fucosidase
LARAQSASPGGKKLRVLSIGVVGTIGSVDRTSVAAHPDVEITGLCDVDSIYLAQAAKEHPNAFTCRDYREVFSKHVDKFDAVIVSVPDHSHAPILLTAMAHDKHVYGQQHGSIQHPRPPSIPRRLRTARDVPAIIWKIPTYLTPTRPMKSTTLLAALALFGSTLAHAEPATESPADYAARMAWFNEARFGMFIHWGVYSEAAGMWNDKPVPGAGEWIEGDGKIPHAEYRSTLLAKFNPVKYDADAWVLAAKNAGMKYIVITSKHHDGFCLWDSQLTDWDIASTQYKQDLLKPLAEACEKYGLKFCVYHSIMDWSHPDYATKTADNGANAPADAAKSTWRGNANNPNPDMDRYTAYLKGQLKELVTNYHPGIMWFDGEWENAWTHERGVDLYNYLRELDPKLIINNRVDKGRAGMSGHTTDAKFKGDYGTPEQEIPATGFGKGVAWESCMTMNDTWGFKTSDTHWKSSEVLIRNLIDIASKGGNYLLNVGPNGAGEIPAASLERLAAIGAWMKTNSESIIGTTASLFPKVSWDGRSTTRRNADGSTTVYLHIFKQPKDGNLTVSGLMTRPDEASILGQPGKLEITGKAGAWTIQVPASAAAPVATVVALSIKGDPNVEAAAKQPAPAKKKKK